MKYFSKLLIIFLISCMTITSCNNTYPSKNSKGYPVALYKGNKWDVIQINDSIVTLIPGLNASNDVKPIVVNIRDLHKTEIE